MALKARVFISCGQAKNTDELEIATEIKNELKKMGYDPYVALDNQSPEGINEIIFKKLANSEYFLFIDFKRERLYKKISKDFEDTKKHRGSLFSN